VLCSAVLQCCVVQEATHTLASCGSGGTLLLHRLSPRDSTLPTCNTLDPRRRRGTLRCFCIEAGRSSEVDAAPSSSTTGLSTLAHRRRHGAAVTTDVGSLTPQLIHTCRGVLAPQLCLDAGRCCVLPRHVVVAVVAATSATVAVTSSVSVGVTTLRSQPIHTGRSVLPPQLSLDAGRGFVLLSQLFFVVIATAVVVVTIAVVWP
jgi:hypothetical protein